MGLTGSSFVKDSLGHPSSVSVVSVVIGIRVNGFPEGTHPSHHSCISVLTEGFHIEKIDPDMKRGKTLLHLPHSPYGFTGYYTTPYMGVCMGCI
jgi:hypothetical protein